MAIILRGIALDSLRTLHIARRDYARADRLVQLSADSASYGALVRAAKALRAAERAHQAARAAVEQVAA